MANEIVTVIPKLTVSPIPDAPCDTASVSALTDTVQITTDVAGLGVALLALRAWLGAKP